MRNSTPCLTLSLALALALALICNVGATLTITQPTSDHWWVAQSLNTLAWTGTDPSEFSVFLANTNTQILTSILALESIVPTYDTSLTINPGTITPRTGYSLLLTNPLNSSDVYATSETFEIKAVGSGYPVQTIAANSSATAVGATSGAASATGTSASGSSTAKSAGLRKAGVAGSGVVLTVGGLVVCLL